ncbi:hypothetical protein FRX31_010868 [Thalictrum thalictroides]|uniref:Uncharacterized protein n=1 Tax=Thalictrum thalictroides TaxID=46969 RepID=A0A7J6WQA2_THATH|nr:hypothetical protein FRX31_010868 [Thalictrum thalictroides]
MRPRGEEVHELELTMALLRNVVLNYDHDEWVWKWHPSEMFTVKSFYSVLIQGHSDYPAVVEQFPFKLAWDPPVPSNVKSFFGQFC